MLSPCLITGLFPVFPASWWCFHTRLEYLQKRDVFIWLRILLNPMKNTEELRHSSTYPRSPRTLREDLSMFIRITAPFVFPFDRWNYLLVRFIGPWLPGRSQTKPEVDESWRETSLLKLSSYLPFNKCGLTAARRCECCAAIWNIYIIIRRTGYNHSFSILVWSFSIINITH